MTWANLEYLLYKIVIDCPFFHLFGRFIDHAPCPPYYLKKLKANGLVPYDFPANIPVLMTLPEFAKSPMGSHHSSPSYTQKYKPYPRQHPVPLNKSPPLPPPKPQTFIPNPFT